MVTSENKSVNKVYKKRPESTRPKMPLSQRAKQFAPFDALAGLNGILKKAEKEHREMLNSDGAEVSDKET